MADSVIEVHGLTRKFRELTAVDDVSFRVHEGEILGFLGPNGARKTTTISAMPGWLPAFARVNPVTYATDAARRLMLTSGGLVRWGNVANDFLFLGAFAAVFATIDIVLSWRYLGK